MSKSNILINRLLQVMLCIAPGLALMMCGMASAAATVKPPNIVLLVSDDQRYRDLGCFGSDEIRTPHLNHLAREGMRLTSFYVTWPACTSSRSSLLTGCYPQRHGVYDMIRNEASDYGKKYTAAEYAATFERIGGMDTREILLLKMLQRAGYVSGIFGKWDLGVHRRFLSLARGFDDLYGFVNTGIDYFTHERYGVPSMYRNNRPIEQDRGTTPDKRRGHCAEGTGPSSSFRAFLAESATTIARWPDGSR